MWLLIFTCRRCTVSPIPLFFLCVFVLVSGFSLPPNYFAHSVFLGYCGHFFVDWCFSTLAAYKGYFSMRQHLKTRCTWRWSDSFFRLWGESPHTCQRGMTLEDSLCAVAIGLDLLDLRRESLHMPARCSPWRLAVCRVIGLGLLDLRREPLHLPVRCSFWRLAIRGIIGLGLLEFEERVIAHASEM